MKTNIEKAKEILLKTDDGDDLLPRDLAILEAAVNDELNELGQQAFDEIHSKVIAGKYEKGWFHGIEHLTIDSEGFVYWKGHHAEHFTVSGYAYTERGRESAESLAQRCRILDQLGIEVSSISAVWHWEKYEQMAREKGILK